MPTDLWQIEQNSSDAIVITTDEQTDGWIDKHSSNVLEFRADQMSPWNLDQYFYAPQTY